MSTIADPLASLGVPVDATSDPLSGLGSPVVQSPQAASTPTAAPPNYLLHPAALIAKTKANWAAGQADRDAEMQVVKQSIDAIKKGDYGTAAETLLSHLYNDVLKPAAVGMAQNAEKTLTGLNPNDAEHPLTTPGVMPMPGIGEALEGATSMETLAPAGPLEAPAKPTSLLQRIKQKISPSAASQPEAQTALRSGAETAAEDAGVAGGNAPEAGIRTLLDKPIERVAGVEKNLYQTLNDAAGADMKDLYEYRERILEALDDPTQVEKYKSLGDELAKNDLAIKVHEDEALSKGVVTRDTLHQAKAATQQRFAMEEGAKKLFNNESVVKGNVAHGSPETLNVDTLIKNAENLDKPSRFAPRGSPTRLQQMLGDDGAKIFKQRLYDAQKAGQTVLTRNKILAALGIGAGATGGIAEALK